MNIQNVNLNRFIVICLFVLYLYELTMHSFGSLIIELLLTQCDGITYCLKVFKEDLVIYSSS